VKNIPKSTKENALGLTLEEALPEKPSPAVLSDSLCECQACAFQGDKRSDTGQNSSIGHGHEFH